MQKLTCAQLANTFQEDADFLGVRYSGWYNGLAKKHAINLPRVKAGMNKVIVHCKANKRQTDHSGHRFCPEKGTAKKKR